MGDARFRFRPQINFFAQYNYYATFSDSFAQLQKIYQANTGQTTLSASEGAFGVQITWPIMDRARSAKARESAADAAHALHDAQNAQITALDGQSRLRHSVTELQSQAEVAGLRQQLAQQQLDALQQQIKVGQPRRPADDTLRTSRTRASVSAKSTSASSMPATSFARPRSISSARPASSSPGSNPPPQLAAAPSAPAPQP